MKKILSLVIIANIFLCQLSAIAQETLPELPVLPDLEIYTDTGADAFAPSSTPAQVAPPKVQTQPKQQSAAQTNTQTAKPAQNTVTPSVNTNNSYYKNNQSASIVVPKGKKFKVKLLTNISSSTPTGARLSFKSIYPETSRYVTIPSGTIFYGKIADSHPPQITGNGGLIVIEVNQMQYKGRTYNIDAKISIANGKHIFLNNIKGKRMYLKNILKAMKPGTTFFKKMWRVTRKLAKNDSGVEIILTPFSFLTGTVVFAINFVASPVIAIFYKGKSITIPAGSNFTIQLREDAVLIK